MRKSDIFICVFFFGALYLALNFLALKSASLKDRDTLHVETKSNIASSRRYEENSQRIKRVEDFCKKYNNDPKTLEVSDNYSGKCSFNQCPVHVLKDYGFSFCFMHKIASTTFQSHFVKLSGFRNLSKHLIQWNGHRLYRISVGALVDEPYLQDYKVLFVRHPFRRLVSAYHAKLIIECSDHRENMERGPLCHVGDEIVEKYRSNDRLTGLVTFKEFVWYILNNSRSSFDTHWTRISNICQPCTAHYDFIGKIETSFEDLNYLYRILGLSDVLDVNTQMNKSQSHLLLRECFSQLSMEEFDELYKVYKEDFELFDYNVDEFRQYIRI